MSALDSVLSKEELHEIAVGFEGPQRSYGFKQRPRRTEGSQSAAKGEAMGFSTKQEYSDGHITEGAHNFMITKAVVAPSKKGEPMLSLRFTVVGNDECAGEHVREYILLKPTRRGYGRLSDLCNAIGVVGSDDGNGLDPHDQGSAHSFLLGKIFSAETFNQESEYLGKVQVSARIIESGFSALNKRQLDALKLSADLPDDAYTGWKGEPLASRQNNNPSSDEVF